MVQKLKTACTRKTVLGITGCFGSGKSTVTRQLTALGAEGVDADQLAHDALKPYAPTFSRIAKLFPRALKAKGKSLDRKKIAEVVFHDLKKRKKLEAIIHPYVFERIAEWMGSLTSNIVLIEVPLLFETGFEQYCDYVVVVSANEKILQERLIRKGFTKEQIKARMKAQWPLKKKIKRADFVVNNSKNLNETKREVKKMWKDLHLLSKGEK